MWITDHERSGQPRHGNDRNVIKFNRQKLHVSMIGLLLSVRVETVRIAYQNGEFSTFIYRLHE